MHITFRIIKVEEVVLSERENAYLPGSAIQLTLRNLDHASEMILHLSDEEYLQNTNMRLGHIVSVELR